MKKAVKIGALFVFCLLLTACSSKDKLTTYERKTDEGGGFEISLAHEGDTLTKFIYVSEYPYDLMGLPAGTIFDEDFKNSIKSSFDNDKEHDFSGPGVFTISECGDKEITITTTLTMAEITDERLLKALTNTAATPSYKDTITKLETMGYTLKK